MVERKSLIIHFENSDALNTLDKNIFHVCYVSEKMNYATVYCDASKYDLAKRLLENNSFILDVEDSLLDVEDHTF